jgi:hypothetical protein
MKIIIDLPEAVKNRFISGAPYTDDMQILAEALIDSTPIDELSTANDVDGGN